MVQDFISQEHAIFETRSLQRLHAFGAFESRAFTYFLVVRSATGVAENTLAVGVGWQIYDLTRSTFLLGMVGLVTFLPRLLLLLPAGHLADHMERRLVGGIGVALEILATAVLLSTALVGTAHVGMIFVALAVLGTGQGFAAPAIRSVLPLVVQREHLNNAVTWQTQARQWTLMGGPVLAGFLYELGAGYVYGASMAMLVVALVCVLPMRVPQGTEPSQAKPEPGRLMAGLRYVWREPVMLGAVSMDLFAVLLGGVTALLPVFAGEVLDVGPKGLGLMRASPAIGAGIAALSLLCLPLRRHIGIKLLGFLAAYGVCNLVFGVSRNLALSMLALAGMGAFNALGSNIRQTMMQLKTPDGMRGRVTAVSDLCAGAASQLGEFESGVTAAWLGTVPSVLLGGAGTLLVAVIWSRLFRPIAEMDGFESIRPEK